MSIKSDKWIRRMAEEHGMIEPFEPNQIKEANGQRIISYGTSSYGYDIRCANEFKNLHQYQQHHRRPEKFRPENLVTVEDDCCIIPPNLLCPGAHSRIFPHPAQRPDRLLGQSTYARCGIIVNVTPFEPGGRLVTLEFSNTTPRLPKSMQAKAWPKSCSLKAMKSAKLHTKTATANTWGKPVLPAQNLILKINKKGRLKLSDGLFVISS